MKAVVSLIILFSGLLNSALVVGECTANRNVDIIITKPDSLYSDPGDGTVTDQTTGLMWQKCSLGLSASNCLTGTILTYTTWQTAFSAAQANTDNGYSDWRLPNKNELESLVEIACHRPAINASIFPNTVIDYPYWTSSAHASYINETWSVSFVDGYVNGSLRNSSHFVRLVRGSQ